MQRTLIVILVFAVLIAIFALQNSAEVVITLWFWKPETSLALVVILTFAAGALVGILFSLMGKKRKKNVTAPELISTPIDTSAEDVPLEVTPQANPEKKGDPEFEDVL